MLNKSVFEEMISLQPSCKIISHLMHTAMKEKDLQEVKQFQTLTFRKQLSKVKMKLDTQECELLKEWFCKWKINELNVNPIFFQSDRNTVPQLFLKQESLFIEL